MTAYYLVTMIGNVWIFSILYMDVLQITISNKLNADLSVTFVTFQTRSLSNYLVSVTIIHDAFFASCMKRDFVGLISTKENGYKRWGHTEFMFV